jgi:neuroligin
VVTTTFGVVRGQTIAPPANDLPPVTQYLGIPYGVQPSGEYRFNMAISAAKWTHMPKDAVTLSKACIQSGMPDISARGEALERMSSQRFEHIKRLQAHLSPAGEDCLYMNLFVPEHLGTFCVIRRFLSGVSLTPTE